MVNSVGDNYQGNFGILAKILICYLSLTSKCYEKKKKSSNLRLLTWSATKISSGCTSSSGCCCFIAGTLRVIKHTEIPK